MAIVVAALCLIPVTALAQSPWTLNRSGFVFENTLLYMSTSEYYDAQGVDSSFTDGSDYRDFTNNLYLEYGIRDWMGLVLNLPIKALQKDYGGTQPTLNQAGFGDLTTALRFRALEWPLVLSAQMEATFPTGYNTTVVNPQLGDGVWNFTGRLLAGRSLYPIRGYVQGGLGYRIRTKNTSTNANYANQVVYNLEGGYWFFEKFLLIGRWLGNKAVGSGTEKDLFGGNLSVQYRISPLVNVSGGVFQSFGGRNDNAGTTFLLGIAFKGNQLGKYEGALSSTLVPTERDAAAVEKPSNRPPPPPPAAPESETEGADTGGDKGETPDEPESGSSP